LSDVSILKDIPNIEILTLSQNSLTSLEHVQHCVNLSELYIRNNHITNLSQIYYLKKLKNLRILWLADNSCANSVNYRQTVLKNLPNLQKLDNTTVTIEDIELALKEGDLIDTPPDSNEIKECEIFDSVEFRNEVNQCILPLSDNQVLTSNEINLDVSIKTDMSSCTNTSVSLIQLNEFSMDLYNTTITDSSVNTLKIVEILKNNTLRDADDEISDSITTDIVDNVTNEGPKEVELEEDKNNVVTYVKVRII
jgi:hypothetical protein